LGFISALRLTRNQSDFAYALLLMLLCCTATAAPQLSQVAPSVFALVGDNAEVSPENNGDVANVGFIVGDSGVIAVDTGISYAAGRRMFETLSEIASKPVTLAILTHPVQEFIFGAAYFQAQGIPLLAHRDAAALMQKRCNNCLRKLNALLGAAAMRGSKVVVPDRLIEQSVTLHLAGRDIDLLYYGHASAPGDLAVFDRQTGTLFAGGLVIADRIPNLRDGKIPGWVSALEQLKTLPIRVVVPGIGPPGGPELIDHTLAYLQALDHAVNLSYRSGASLIEAIKQVQLVEFKNLSQYELMQPQNVQYRYRQLEDEDPR
jgi:glyoxylase-like metal-dependent hydrolase (beta-lactamase superfamily II)